MKFSQEVMEQVYKNVTLKKYNSTITIKRTKHKLREYFQYLNPLLRMILLETRRTKTIKNFLKPIPSKVLQTYKAVTSLKIKPLVD